MTVQQLVEYLQGMPQDLPVYVADWQEGHGADFLLDPSEDNLPRVCESFVQHPKWNHPRRVVIG